MVYQEGGWALRCSRRKPQLGQFSTGISFDGRDRMQRELASERMTRPRSGVGGVHSEQAGREAIQWEAGNSDR